MTVLLIAVALLGHPRFAVREAVQAALSPANTFTLPLLEWAERHHVSHEVQRRCSQLIDAWYVSNIDWLPMPCIWHPVECYYSYQRQAEEIWGRGEDWTDYREGTRLWCREQIEMRQPIRGVLTRLWREEWSYFWRTSRFPWCR